MTVLDPRFWTIWKARYALEGHKPVMPATEHVCQDTFLFVADPESVFDAECWLDDGREETLGTPTFRLEVSWTYEARMAEVMVMAPSGSQEVSPALMVLLI